MKFIPFTSILLVLYIVSNTTYAQVKSSIPVPGYYSEPPLVEIIYAQEARPETENLIGTLDVTTGAFPDDCSLTSILEQARFQAAKAGGNTVYIKMLKNEGEAQPCYSLKAEVYLLTEAYTSSINKNSPQGASARGVVAASMLNEIMPQFPGGDDEMVRFIYANLRYPMEALVRNKKGVVRVEFIVDETGKIKDINVAQRVNRDLDREAVRIVASMPEWVPGFQNGVAVPVLYNLPIRFETNSPFSKRRKNK